MPLGGRGPAPARPAPYFHCSTNTAPIITLLLILLTTNTHHKNSSEGGVLHLEGQPHALLQLLLDGERLLHGHVPPAHARVGSGDGGGLPPRVVAYQRAGGRGDEERDERPDEAAEDPAAPLGPPGRLDGLGRALAAYSDELQLLIISIIKLITNTDT